MYMAVFAYIESNDIPKCYLKKKKSTLLHVKYQFIPSSALVIYDGKCSSSMFCNGNVLLQYTDTFA